MLSPPIEVVSYPYISLILFVYICGVRTWAGIGIDDCNPLLAGSVLEEALLRAVVSCAGQPGEVDEDGDLLLECLGREEEVEGHLAVCGRGIVGELEQLAAEGGDGCFGCDGHCECVLCVLCVIQMD